MKPTLDDAIAVLRRIAADHMTDENGHIFRRLPPAMHDVLVLLDRANEIEGVEWPGDFWVGPALALRLKPRP